jgi:hypothetical protein
VPGDIACSSNSTTAIATPKRRLTASTSASIRPCPSPVSWLRAVGGEAEAAMGALRRGVQVVASNCQPSGGQNCLDSERILPRRDLAGRIRLACTRGSRRGAFGSVMPWSR